MIKIIQSKKYKWQILENYSDEIQECLDCGYEGKDVAESDSFIFDEKTGERHIFCPKCKSWDYYIK